MAVIKAASCRLSESSNLEYDESGERVPDVKMTL